MFLRAAPLPVRTGSGSTTSITSPPSPLFLIARLTARVSSFTSSATFSPSQNKIVYQSPSIFCIPLFCGPRQTTPSTHRRLHRPPLTSPVSESTARHYLVAIRAWHIAQGWGAPLTDERRKRIHFSLRGIAKQQGDRHKKPLHPPVTTSMLFLFRSSLDLSSPFDVCVWAIATCSFWGMVRLDEATVKAKAAFSPPVASDSQRHGSDSR